MVSVLVGWCLECKIAVDPYPGPGTMCPAGGCLGPNMTYRTLSKRRMFYCKECTGYYLTRKGLDAHEHWDWE